MGDRKGKSNKGRHVGKEIALQQPRATSEVVTSFDLQLRTVPQPTAIAAITQQRQAITSIQTSLVDTDEKIDILQNKVQELEREKSTLQKELESKKREIALLKKKVVGLESDKKKLEGEVKNLKSQIEEHEIEINCLTAQMENLQQENEEEKSQMAILRADMSNMKKDLEETNRDKANLKARLAKMEIQHRMNTPEQEMTQESMAFIVLSEMCRQLQNKMYQEVFPEDFSDYNYTVKQLKEDIKESDPEQRAEVEKRWVELKTRLGWDDQLIKTIRSLKQDRNASAHPEITEEQVRWFLHELMAGNKLPVRGRSSAVNIKSLVDMWAILCVR